MLWQPPLPPKYTTMGDEDLIAAIAARKRELGDRLIILGHHYQQDDVVRFADFTGDSFKLSQLAAERVKERGAEFVIFCGVHFMAESANILAPEGTRVILPDLSAGCSMADMADYDDVVDAWAQIKEAMQDGVSGIGYRVSGQTQDRVAGGGARVSGQTPDPRPQTGSVRETSGGASGASGGGGRVIPICYMNSTAAIKAFCGEHGGAVCTSSNAAAILEWALAGGTQPRAEGEDIKILFLPDQHLGRNTAAALGYDVATQTCVWDPRQPLGGNEEDVIQRSTFLLWKGHCSVHKLFRPEHVDQVRALWPDVTVMVHPECDHAVVLKADRTGSTEGIIKAVEAAPPGSRWAIGTEVHLVNRIANEARKRNVTVRILSDCQCLCTTMYRIDMPHLLWALDNLAAGNVVNEITVPKQVKHFALVALNRMLSLTAAAAKKPAIPREAGAV